MEVFDSNTGRKAGENSIVKMEQGCMLLERWQGDSGSTGTSLNYYNSGDPGMASGMGVSRSVLDRHCRRIAR